MIRPPFRSIARFAPVVIVLGLGLAALMTAQWSGLKRSRDAEQHIGKVSKKLPHLESVKDYASSHRCQSCHPGEYASWHRSYHRTMTQIAVPGNVVGAFDGTTVISDGLDYRVTREGDGFWAEMPDPDVMM